MTHRRRRAAPHGAGARTATRGPGPCCRTGRGRSRSALGRAPASQPTTRGGRRFSSPVTANTRAAPAASPPARSPCPARATLSGRACGASFAALFGVSPVERSSGRRQFRRLNRGGDRQANVALHRIVFIRLRVDPRTPDYYERRIKEDKTRREIVRRLKRYAARDVFHLVGQLQPGPRS
ncbi:transposase [Streptomyces sp. NBC_00016]|uniref:transposase n=1 Tax=Streptomyces sp. NBC_00016 TaxID=2975622 RepID=UPI00386BF563